MSLNLVQHPIPDEPEQLVILDAKRRLYAALSSKGDSWHVVQPARPDDARVADGKIAAGDLACICPAGQYARTCWAVKIAIAAEAQDRFPWIPDAAPGELMEAWGK